MRLSRIFCIGLVLLLFQGCAKDNNAWVRDRAEDYKKSEMQPSLLIPEEFKTVPKSDRYHID